MGLQRIGNGKLTDRLRIDKEQIKADGHPLSILHIYPFAIRLKSFTYSFRDPILYLSIFGFRLRLLQTLQSPKNIITFLLNPDFKDEKVKYRKMGQSQKNEFLKTDLKRTNSQLWMYGRRVSDGQCSSLPLSYVTPQPQKDQVWENVDVALRSVNRAKCQNSYFPIYSISSLRF